MNLNISVFKIIMNNQKNTILYDLESPIEIINLIHMYLTLIDQYNLHLTCVNWSKLKFTNITNTLIRRINLIANINIGEKILKLLNYNKNTRLLGGVLLELIYGTRFKFYEIMIEIKYNINFLDDPEYIKEQNDPNLGHISIASSYYYNNIIKKLKIYSEIKKIMSEFPEFKKRIYSDFTAERQYLLLEYSPDTTIKICFFFVPIYYTDGIDFEDCHLSHDDIYYKNNCLFLNPQLITNKKLLASRFHFYKPIF